ncbi:BMC domain protein [Pseudoramibacter alactolyticus ATCC 23263]|jgi:ethanolamine utilization protein EutS|uniref:BMC domain protein n=1 Tax=Pseudoramibacter alactolyticus ATCC 23263 TaxID=887929 RepID=E6MF92_9FIRM|nr:BMC domain-containing protein [Pseudoramibacter alactolyticus]EFV02252.1 BMC domain protein [Pseudoramibacter alactolyticus ATCC 23263]MBM6969306.1 BMC domain-containing protein [Pseudoramibacter alactolyticus]
MPSLDKDREGIERSIQEYVPGKQVTLAHVIANPKHDVYVKLGLEDDRNDAIGILTITPSEASIISADVGTKAAAVQIGFLDRFSGSLVITGAISDVNSAVRAIIEFLKNTLGFDVPDHITHS